MVTKYRIGKGDMMNKPIELAYITLDKLFNRIPKQCMFNDKYCISGIDQGDYVICDKAENDICENVDYMML
jgi:hypothetical protein